MSLSAEYASAASDLTSLLGAVQAGAWEGPSAEGYVSAHVPYLAWLAEASENSASVAAQHEVAAVAYTTALATMPTMPELVANHTIHGVLIATNFFGINTIPIALNEVDYARMWVQAATTMSTYQAVSGAAMASAPRTSAAPPVVKTNSAASAAADPSSGNFLTEIFNQLVQLIQDPSGTIGAILANPSQWFPLLFFVAYEAFFIPFGTTFWSVLLSSPALIPLILGLALGIPAFLAQQPADVPAVAVPGIPNGQNGGLPAAAVTPTTVVSSAAAPSTSPVGTAAGAPAATPATAGFGYVVGVAGPDDGPGPTLIDRDQSKAPASSIAAAAGVSAVSRAKSRTRRRRKSEIHDHADEFADMNVEVDPDWSANGDREPVAATVGSDRGAGPLGFAGTVDKDIAAAATGLATLNSNGFGGGPTMPMVPGTWDPEVPEGEGGDN